MKQYDNFDDIVFRIRNKEYGAFALRKRYNHNVIISLLIGIMIMAAAIIIPYYNVKSLVSRNEHSERQVEIVMQDLDQPHELVVPPPLPPVHINVNRQVKYVPPVVVDSIKPEDVLQQMTADEAQQNATSGDVLVAKENREEVQEKETEQEPFLSVQEMPEPPGGEEGLSKYILDHTNYPVIAKENNIQGKVYVRFCVTAMGTIEQVSVLKGVDPDLDAEAIRIVKTFPPFKPGKQEGRPVPVWFSVAINFQL